MREHDFRIGGVKFRISAPFVLEAEERWQRFSAQFDRPDHCYRLSYAPGEPECTEAAEYRDERVKCCHRNGRPLRIYYRSDHRAYASVLEKRPDTWDITLRQELLPWGSRLEHLFVLYGLPRALLRHGSLLLHGSYILTDRGAIVFTAPSGTGKSTQAELWSAHRGSTVVNGDRVILSIENGRAYAHGMVHSGSSPECENISAPLRAVVCLSQAQENRVGSLKGMQALRALLRGTYLLPEFREDMDHLMGLARQLCEAVPVLHLACLPDVTAVETLETALAAIDGED